MNNNEERSKGIDMPGSHNGQSTKMRRTREKDEEE